MDTIVLVAEPISEDEAIGLITGLESRIHGERRFELQRLAQTQQLHPVAQQVQGAAVVELRADAVQKNGFGRRAVGLGQRLPGAWLSLPDPGEQVRREQSAGAVITLDVAGFIEPTVGGQVGADVVLEGAFLMQTHCLLLSVNCAGTTMRHC